MTTEKNKWLKDGCHLNLIYARVKGQKLKDKHKQGPTCHIHSTDADKLCTTEDCSLTELATIIQQSIELHQLYSIEAK